MNSKYQTILHDLKEELLGQPLLKFQTNSDWMAEIPKKPGVYLFHLNEKIIYVGESGNLQGRMKDLRNTQNHNLRRLLGELKYSNDANYWKASSRRKFHPEIEVKLQNYMKENLYVQMMPTVIGRKEVEELLTSELEGLLNKRLKRK